MELKRAKEIVTSCIDALPKPDRRRIGYHAEKSTPVLCGPKLESKPLWDNEDYWVAPNGIALAVCASTRTVPSAMAKSTEHWERRDAILRGSNRLFTAAMKRLNPKTLRKIMLSYA